MHNEDGEDGEDGDDARSGRWPVCGASVVRADVGTALGASAARHAGSTVRPAAFCGLFRRDWCSNPSSPQVIESPSGSQRRCSAALPVTQPKSSSSFAAAANAILPGSLLQDAG